MTANRPTGIRSSKSSISRVVFIVGSLRRGSVPIRVLQVGSGSPRARSLGDWAHLVLDGLIVCFILRPQWPSISALPVDALCIRMLRCWDQHGLVQRPDCKPILFVHGDRIGSRYQTSIMDCDEKDILIPADAITVGLLITRVYYQVVVFKPQSQLPPAGAPSRCPTF